jgi:hypothetical protein
MRFAVVHDNSDNPYGFSWLLLVDRERELTTGDTALRPLADFAAQQILVDLHALDKATAEARIASTEYVNLSWTILTLNAWAKFTNNATYQAAVDQATNDWLMDPAVDAMCPFAKDTAPNATGFFAPCLLRLATVVDVKGPEAARSWVTQRLPSTLDIQPITSPNGIHAHSLNFSRAVGLWGIFVTTGDTRYQEAFAQLMNYQMAHPDIWRTNYANYAHWVAQFGVLAIDRTYAQFPG